MPFLKKFFCHVKQKKGKPERILSWLPDGLDDYDDENVLKRERGVGDGDTSGNLVYVHSVSLKKTFADAV